MGARETKETLTPDRLRRHLAATGLRPLFAVCLKPGGGENDYEVIGPEGRVGPGIASAMLVNVYNSLITKAVKEEGK